MAQTRGRGRRASKLGMRPGWTRDFPTKKKPKPPRRGGWLRTVFGLFPGGDRYRYTMPEPRSGKRRRRK